MSRAWGDSEFLAALTAPIEVRISDIERAELLLSDYLHCVFAGQRNSIAQVEPLTLAAELAKAASYNDLDDVDWSLLIHPGSIVNSALFALIVTREIEMKNVVPAMIAGYAATNHVAGILAAGHSAKWHATATTGIFGATCASARLLQLDLQTTERAIKLASASMGGGANASISRNGATRFTRIHATVMGLLATLEAMNEAPAPDEIVDGVGGLATRFELLEAAPAATTEPLAQVSLRYFPWSGFSQGALVALRSALPIEATQIKSVQIQTPTRIFPLVGGESKGDWWSIAAAVRSTLLTGNPMVKSEAPASFSVATSDSGSNEGQILIATNDRQIEIPFGLSNDFGVDTALLTQKWRDLAGAKSLDISGIAHRLVSSAPSTQVRSDLLQVLQVTR